MGTLCMDGLNSRTEQIQRILGKPRLHRRMGADPFAQKMGKGQSTLGPDGTQRVGEPADKALLGSESDVFRREIRALMDCYYHRDGRVLQGVLDRAYVAAPAPAPAPAPSPARRRIHRDKQEGLYANRG